MPKILFTQGVNIMQNTPLPREVGEGLTTLCSVKRHHAKKVLRSEFDLVNTEICEKFLSLISDYLTYKNKNNFKTGAGG